METAIVQPLDYASPRTKRGGRPGFRAALTLFAVGGILVNFGFIASLTQQLHQALWVYHDLMQNSRAYGREVDPATIASLRDTRALWTAFGAFGFAAALGLLLAVNLLVAAHTLDREGASADRRLTQYRRWKPQGIALTVVTLLWVDHVNSSYWVTATRHMPVGSGPPFISDVVLVLCAMLPWWWVGRRSVGEAAAG